MNGLDAHQSVIIHSNGSGIEDSAYYEALPSGLLAKIYSVNGDVRIELITNVPGLSEARCINTDDNELPPLGIEVNSNGICGISQLLENRSKVTEPSSPETPTNQTVPHPLTMPATPRALRHSGSGFTHARLLSPESPCPTHGGLPSPTFAHHISPERSPRTARHYNTSPFPPCRPHSSSGMKPFSKEVSPDPTEIVSSDRESDQDEFPRMEQTKCAYGQYVSRDSVYGRVVTSSTAKTKRTGHRGEKVSIPADSTDVSHGLAERSAPPRSNGQDSSTYAKPIDYAASTGKFRARESRRKFTGPERMIRSKNRVLSCPVKRSARLAAKRRV